MSSGDEAMRWLLAQLMLLAWALIVVCLFGLGQYVDAISAEAVEAHLRAHVPKLAQNDGSAK